MVTNTVEQVAEMGLCVGCGVCRSVCPLGAVKIVRDQKKGIYKPVVSQKCNECGLCVETCFGLGINEKMGLNIFGENQKDTVLGTCSNCYVGYAHNHRIRYNSASGGIVTALLLHILEEKLVNGVLVTKMNERRPLEPMPFIARNKSEIISAAGSKYCPVPVGVALKTIMQEDGHFAVVGLPCHIYGIRKARKIYPDLAEKIVFHIGIFCGGMQSFLATEYLLRRLKVRREEVMQIAYRGEGWPGKMVIELKGTTNDSREKMFLPYPHYWKYFGSFFLPCGCALCTDGFNAFADISCGDAWLPEYQNDNLGTSLIITRNRIGEQIVNDACGKGRIHITKIECEKVKQAQKSMIQLKTQHQVASFQLFRALGKSVPTYHSTNVEMRRPTLGAYLRCFLLYILGFIASKRSLWNVLDIYCFLRQHFSKERRK